MAQDKELKSILEKLHTVIKSTNEFSREQVKINRDLLKVMSLINDGYAKNADDAKQLIGDITDGVEDVDQFFEKWSKARGATKKDLEEIRKKFKEIEGIDEDIIESSKEYIDLLKERHNLLDDEVDLGKGLLSNYNQILKVVRESKKQYSSLTSNFDDIQKGVERIIAKKVDLGSMFDGTFSSTDALQKTLGNIQNDIDGMVANVSGNYYNVDLHFNPLTDDLDREVNGILELIEKEKNSRIEGLTEYFEKNKYLQTQLSRQMAADLSGMQIKIDVDTGDIQTANGLIKRGTSEFQAMADQLDAIAMKDNILAGVQGSFAEIAALTKLGALRTDEQNQKYDQLIQKLGIAGSLMVQQLDHSMNLLNADAEQLLKQKQTLNLTGKYIGQLKSAETIVTRVGHGFDYINSILPSGIGEFLGISRVSQDLIDSHKRGVQEFSKNLSEGVTYSKAMQGYFKTFRPALLSAINPVTILITSFVLLYKFAESVADKYKDMAQNMKISVGQARNLLNVQLDILSSQENQFAQLKDIQAVQTEMIGSSGKVFKAMNNDSKEMVLSLVNMGKYFGYGNEQAVELHKTFTRLGANDKMARNLQKNLGYMSEMVGLSPQIIAQDLIENADMVATYFAGMPDKAAKAAIEVRKVGMSLKQAGSIAQKMLDLEGFMTDMYELYAMTGKGIDFSEAFDLGLSGDIEGMAKSMVKEIGTLNDLNNMDYLTRSKIAKTMGIQVDELANMVKMNEEMGYLSKDQQKWLEQNYKTMGDISALSDQDIQAKINQGMATDRLAVAWEKIKAVLFKSLLPLVETLADAIDAINPVIDLVIFGLKGVVSVFKIINPIVKGLLLPFQLISSAIGYLTGSTSSFTQSLEETIKPLNWIEKLIYGVGAALGSWYLFKKAPKIFDFVADGVKSIGTKIPLIGGMFGKLFSSLDSSNVKSASVIEEVGNKTISETSKMATKSADIAVKTVAASTDSISKTSEEAVKQSEINTTEAVKTAKIANEKIKKSSVDVKKEITKPTKMGFVSVDMAKTGFKLVGEMASKTIAATAANGIKSLLGIKATGEEQTSAIGGYIDSMVSTAAGGIGTVLSTSIEQGVEKTFTKRLEKRIESSLEGPIKKATKSFDGMETKSGNIFSRIAKRGLGVFGLFSKVKIDQPFDQMSDVADSALDQMQEARQQIDKPVVNPIEKGIEPETKNVEPVKKPIEPKKEEIKPIEHKTDSKVQPEKQLQEQPEKVKPKQSIDKPVVDDKKIESKVKKTGNILTNPFDFLKNSLKEVWNGIKTVLTDIVNFVSKSLKTLSSGIGTAIKNLLKGIGDGLSSFKTSAIKGAASFVIISSAMWILSKAVQNFTSVKWEDLAKAGLALGGLTVAAMLLGKSSGQMILGSAAIAILGASLIPAAYALKQFSQVDWSSLGKAALSIAGLGIIASVISPILPLLIPASIGIAMLGASLIPLTFALEKLNSVEWSGIAKGAVALLSFSAIASGIALVSPLILTGSLAIAALGLSLIPLTEQLNKFNNIEMDKFFQLGQGLLSVAAAAAIFSLSIPTIVSSSVTIAASGIVIDFFAKSIQNLNSVVTSLDASPLLDFKMQINELLNINPASLLILSSAITTLGASLLSFQTMATGGNVISKIFGNNSIERLKELANLANPLQILADSISKINENIVQFLENFETIDFKKFQEFDDITIKSNLNQKIEKIGDQQVQRDNTQVKIAPVQVQVPNILPPKPEQVAQDVKISDPLVLDQKIKSIVKTETKNNNSYVYETNQDKSDFISDNLGMEQRLDKIAYLLELLLRKDSNNYMDSYKVNSILKAKSNN